MYVFNDVVKVQSTILYLCTCICTCWTTLLIMTHTCGNLVIEIIVCPVFFCSDARSSNAHNGIPHSTRVSTSQLSGSDNYHCDHLWCTEPHVIGSGNTCFSFVWSCESIIITARCVPGWLALIFISFFPSLFQSFDAIQKNQWKKADKYGRIALYLTIVNWIYVLFIAFVTFGCVYGFIEYITHDEY